MFEIIFKDAINKKKKVLLTFFSKQDNRILKRVCAPLDYGPKRKIRNQDDRYHFWDYDSDTKIHPLSLLPAQVYDVEVLDEIFDPAEFIDWEPEWFYPRDWGRFS